MRFGQALAIVAGGVLIGSFALYELFTTPNGVTHERDEPVSAHVEEAAPDTYRPFTVTINIPSTFGGQTVEAETNLPDDTQLIASLQPPDCTPVPDCSYVWWAKVAVRHGHFTLGPFGVKPGPYSLLITTPFSSTEPPEVRAVIGQNGENLRGPYLRAELVPGAGPTVEYIANVTVPATDPTLLPESPDGVSPSDEPSDPLAGDYNAQALAEYDQQRAAFLNQVRRAYFSVGCKVFASEAGVAALVGVEYGAMDRKFTATDSNLRTDMQSAAREGLARADKPSECGYWHQHPEEVYELRQEAVAAASAR
jgi:hypothetical protein